jgi:exo-beta-1,3-glucanase (GH17 family)
MRSFFSLSALSLGALVVLGPAIASAHDSPVVLFKRTGAGFSHRRVVNSRRADLTKRSASDASELAALELVNSTIANKTNLVAASAGADPAGALAGSNTTSTSNSTTLGFPDLGFKMPSTVPSSLDGWWTNASEYAFMGFSYEVTACQSASELKKDFLNIRNKFNGRYVRLYGTCDTKGFYDTVVEAAWEATLGVHALIWFGFDGGNQWETRRDTLFADLKSNPKAKFVTRLVQMGSEPLFDSVLSVPALAAQVTAAKKTLAPLGIPVTVSDMVYGFTKDGGSQAVLEAIDQISIHELPFFSTKATTGGAAWPLVESDIEWAMGQKALKGKKILLDENGWPSVTGSGVSANSKQAVASIAGENAYYDLLDSQCSYFKKTNNGIGWFAHIYSDDMEPEYGIYDDSGKMKFAFKPKTSC